MEKGISTRLSAADGRKFGFTVGLAFALFAGIAWWRGHTMSWPMFAVLAGLFLTGGALVPSRLGTVQRTWMELAILLSKVTTPIIMGVVYFLVITPIALFTRAIGRQHMRHPEKNGSFWADVGSEGRSDMERQF